MRPTIATMDAIKAHGTANDFVVFLDPDDQLALPATLVRALADRRRGVGADGVIRIGGGRAGADVFMDYRNADGSIVEMCGNGVRVVAKLALDHGLLPSDRDEVVVDTRAGHRSVRISGRDDDGRVAEVEVDMGPPSLDPAVVPFATDEPEAPRHHLVVDGHEVGFSVVSMGNPHAVIIVEDVDAAPVRRVGPLLEHHDRFPEGVNVGFVEPIDQQRVRLRVWERGVGETAACGTGACAAVAALQRLGLVDGTVAVELPGGTLSIGPSPHGSILMRGPAEEVARFTLDDAWLAAHGDGSTT